MGENALLGGLFLEQAVPASLVACVLSGGSASVSFLGLPWGGGAVEGFGGGGGV